MRTRSINSIQFEAESLGVAHQLTEFIEPERNLVRSAATLR